MSCHDESFWSDGVYDVYTGEVEDTEENKERSKSISSKRSDKYKMDWNKMRDLKGYADMSEIKEVESVLKVNDHSADRMKAYRNIEESRRKEEGSSRGKAV